MNKIHMTSSPMRSVLYCPANNQRAIQKVPSIAADWIVFDLEDSVAPDVKGLAREALKSAFDSGQFSTRKTAIRCNSVDTEYVVNDMRAVAQIQPDAVLLPKVSSAQDVETFVSLARNVALNKSVRSWFMLETARGVNNVNSIVEAGLACDWPVQALVVGHNDLSSETNVTLEHERHYMVPWLMQVVLAAKAHDLQVLDSVWNNFKDVSGFEAEALQGRRMGFDGKTLIHPLQVEVANIVFSPTEEELASAQLIVETFERPENQLANVVNLQGEMVERLHYQRARKLLEKYTASDSQP